MNMFHAAIFANRQPLAGYLQLLFTNIVLFTGLKAFGGRLMGRGHGAMPLDVLLGLLAYRLLGERRKTGAKDSHCSQTLK